MKREEGGPSIQQHQKQMTINSASKSSSPVRSGTRANHKPFKSNEQLSKSPPSKRDPMPRNRQTTVSSSSSSSSSASKIYSPQLRATATPNRPGSAYYANEDLESVFVEELLSHQKEVNESKARKELKNFTNLPGSTVHPHAENQMLLLRRRERAGPSSTSPGGKLVSTHSRVESVPRRHDLKRLSNEESTSRNTSAKSIKDGRHKVVFTPYVEVNSKISRVLQHSKPRDTKTLIQASKLDEYYRLVTKETSAAIILQSQCRRVLAAERCKELAFRWKKATMIQCLVRSYFARKQLSQLMKEKKWATGVRNQIIRVYVSQYRRRKRIEHEHYAAIVCQCAVRVYLAWKVTNQSRLQFSWELNQSRWRAISIRVAWADNRVNYHARQIQCVVRRELARRRVLNIHVLYNRSSTCIQACWRRYIVRKQWSTMMYNLNVEARCTRIRIITCEHRFWRDKVEDLASKPQQKRYFEAQRANLEKERCDLHDKIRALELHYRDQLYLLGQTTPQKIAEGWDEQIRINLKDVRERITKAKLELFFSIERKLKSVVKEIHGIQQMEDDAKYRMEHWSAWLDDEMDELWQYQRQHDRSIEEEERKQIMNHEWMVWAVKFRMPSGKPDKRRPLVRHLHTAVPDCTSSERLHQLIDATKLKADETLAVNHLAHTFQPFQNMWDRFNALNANDFTFKGALSETPLSSSSVPGRETTTDVILPIKPNNKRIIPNKLPWNLLHKVKAERERIEADFGSNN